MIHEEILQLDSPKHRTAGSGDRDRVKLLLPVVELKEGEGEGGGSLADYMVDPSAPLVTRPKSSGDILLLGDATWSTKKLYFFEVLANF